MGNNNSKIIEKIKPLDFGSIAGDISQVSTVQSINGFQITHVGQIIPNCNLVQTLTLNPRVYPIELAAKSNEPAQPGSYSSVLVGDLIDMPYRISYNFGGKLSAELTVPFSKNINITLGSDIHYNPEITSQFKYSGDKYSSEITFTTNDYFKKGHLVASFATVLKNSIHFSSLFSQKLFSNENMFRFAFILPYKKIDYGFLINKTDVWTFSLSTKKIINSDIIVGGKFDFIPSNLRSAYSFGFDKSFLMSRLQVSLTSDALLSTVYRRKFSKEKQITFSISSNILTKEYSFGVGLLIN